MRPSVSDRRTRHTSTILNNSLLKNFVAKYLRVFNIQILEAFEKKFDTKNSRFTTNYVCTYVYMQNVAAPQSSKSSCTLKLINSNSCTLSSIGLSSYEKAMWLTMGLLWMLRTVIKLTALPHFYALTSVDHAWMLDPRTGCCNASQGPASSKLCSLRLP